ncbi:hypothetical protein H0I23_01570 [Cellulophaga sp. HaHaR_3_176]|uniref:hypothetical protein n=1 Tax=Cellulophaga sp. HaHaR_3_176 TaxID=1942464 RepID=UPI001C1F5AC9|nr:hypothetical protein [Cellulophaga sp. HaHaR_3_176]QWX84367.1 hypothetical protein H0I23_01570 [Cellulophaga sp. HaHaR_3_176]
MENFNYCFTLINRNNQEAILSNITDIDKIKPFLSDALFEYINTEAKIGRLNASKLKDIDVVCIIQKKVSLKAS